MTWVLPEILIPLLLALGLGVLIGWLLWRWRRRSIHASEWNQLASNSAQAQADVAAIRAAYEEANNERSILTKQLAALTEEFEASQANERVASDRAENLFADLEISKSELSQATEQAASLQTELLAATASMTDRDALDEELARLRDELEAGALRRSELEQAVEERDHELERTLVELNDAVSRAEVLQAELQATNVQEVGDAEAKTAELEAALAAARTELDVSQSRIADFDARLSTTNADLDAAHARVSELEARAHEEETGGAELIGQLRVELAERDRRIAALEAAAAPAGVSSDTHVPRHGFVSTTSDTPPRSDATGDDIGISIADHVDDLKVIRGIGPRMEELLTTLGITSWEQLADLDEAGVARVDNALGEFPGRIERDQWVDQARELVSRFPDATKRPTRETFLNRTNDEDPFN